MADDPIAAANYVAQMNALATAARMVRLLDLDELAATISHAHAVGPVLDPTGYRDGLQNLRDQEKLLAAARVFKEAADSVAGEVRL